MKKLTDPNKSKKNGHPPENISHIFSLLLYAGKARSCPCVHRHVLGVESLKKTKVKDTGQIKQVPVRQKGDSAPHTIKKYFLHLHILSLLVYSHQKDTDKDFSGFFFY